MKEIFLQISNRQDLSQDQVQAVFDRILKNEVSESQIAAFLMGLKTKGETADEITGIVRALKSHATVLPEIFTDAMCNCGTGGDQSYSFNISTTVCFVLAAGGIRMAKAGNRSISSKSGSADVLEALGINVAASPETLSKALDEVGLAFIFAQTMHPAMRFIGPARQALGIPTIMNLVGPLANPLDLETQLMGLYRVELQEIVANAIQQLGRKRAVIITGPDNMDEAALYGTNTYTLLEDGHISQHTFTYEDLGMEKVELSDITGGDAKENAEILLSVLKNEDSPYLETTVLNAGLGFFANGKVETIKEGVELARQLIADGSALEKLRQLQEVQAFLPTILEQKEKEVAQLVMEDLQPLRQTYRLYDFLKSNQNKLQIISEVKKASPSMGDINLDVDIVAQAKTYEENGAAMISVLTDEVFFKGDISYLKEISSQVAIPTLAKDFIIDEKQIVRSRNAGATVILLIVAALPEARLKELYDFATSLGLEVLVETHNLPELEVAHRIGAEIIGVNNRNLVTFETDINTSLELSTHFKDKPVYISESAIFTGQDAALVAPYFNGILVGTALMTADNVAEKVKELQIDKG